MTHTSVYLYGFVPSGTPPPEELRGVADREVEVLELGPFAAAVSQVPAADYAPDSLEANLRDLDWVAEQGLRHERVVTWFVDRAWILPARLLTLHSSGRSLRAEVAAHAPRLERQLRRLRGCREWDLKVSYDEDRLRPHLPELSRELADLEERIGASAPGTRYLLERRRAGIVAREALAAARQLAAELLEASTAFALDLKRMEPPREVEELPVVLNAALLVRAEAEAGLRLGVESRAAELEELGVRVALSGPWAPYRFLEGASGEPS